MVGGLREAMETHKSPSFFQCVGAMRNFFDEMQMQTKRGLLTQRKAVPVGLFCMSEPVAHADDDDKDDDEEYNMQSQCPMHGTDTVSTPQMMGDVVDNVSLHKESITSLKADVWQEPGSGRFKICWSSGSSYEGEVLHGNLHGVGTFRGADGSVYEGNWILNNKHGFGWKRYPNGDVYEGSWKWDVPDGQGSYFWCNGNKYYGGWKGGLMSGRGVLSWVNGDSYDGLWLDGVADGHGAYTWEDGSTYFGKWRKGLKHGEGRFYPPGSRHVEADRLHCAFSVFREELSATDGMVLQSPCRQKICSPSHLPRELRRLCQGSPMNQLSFGMIDAPIKGSEESDIQMRSFDCDAGVHSDDKDSSRWVGNVMDGSVSQRRDISLWEVDDSEERSWLSSRRKQCGEIIVQGHRSYDLMMNLQVGIRYSVGKVTPERKRKLVLADFSPKSSIRVSFPSDGSQLTPPHHSASFRWKDYCPMVFRYLRENFDIDAADYMISVCGNAGLRELLSPGKSGSVFYISQDERFMIKTLSKAEVKVLLGMLPRYYKHVRMHKNTLLTRFFGLHRIKRAGGQKVRFIVMGNVIAADVCIHSRFDLKGSSQGRSADKDATDVDIILKDLDLDMSFHLDPPWRNAVLEQIYHDCLFLECENIMDYSLLLGIHFKSLPPSTSTSNSHSYGSGSPLRTSPRQGRCDVQVGSNMPAMAICSSGMDADKLGSGGEVYDVTLYFGIIDILQEYDTGKKLEHAYKSLQFDSLSISAVDPVSYSKRFQHFIRVIFPGIR